MEENLESLKFPIGRFELPKIIDKTQINLWIAIIENFPKNIIQETNNLTEEDLEKRYRPDGWTIRQVVHHCADSHLNSFMRFKLALTEDTPTIKTYHEHLWADLPDAKHFPIGSSIKILEGLHARWTCLLKSLSDEDLEKQFQHPETKNLIRLKTNIGIYAWHCEHHLNHIINAKKR